MPSQFYQICYVTDSIGHVHVFTGPVAFGLNTKLQVSRLQFSEPIELPEGYSFEEIHHEEQEEYPGD